MLVLIAAVLTGCNKEDTRPVSKYYLLPLIETTDIHGYVVSDQNGVMHYRMAYIADKANDIRTKGGEYRADRLLLMDGGDLYQGTSISYLLSGWPVYVAMDRMGYDAVALGNHDFDWGFEKMVDPDATMLDYELDGRNYTNAIPVLCANLFLDNKRASCTKDYAIVEKTAVNASGDAMKVKIGIIGFAVDYSASIMASRFKDLGYSIKEDYSIANGIAAELESSGRCDATILLIHGAADVAAEKLGQDSVIDLVLGGHSHAAMSGWSSSGITYLQGGRYNEYYAIADLEFTVDDGGSMKFNRICNQKIMTVDAGHDQHSHDGENSNDLDEDILALSDNAISATAEQFSDVIGHITVNASNTVIEGSGGRATVMSNWVCDLLRRIGDADVSFVNGGGVRTSFSLGGLSSRDITVADVFGIFPFNNITYVYKITYAELLKVFVYSMTSAGQSLFTGMVGIDCHYRGENVISLTKDGVVIYRDGKWTGDWASRTVVLAVSEFLATSRRTDAATGLDNPLPDWNGTTRLLSNGLIDNENAIIVLRKEAAASGGHLYIDTRPHFIEE
jgi:2',3'-cyclic-nucleotide 2'-phosphodiesterase (5'-nucleotidase family)